MNKAIPKNFRNWAMIFHFAGLIGSIFLLFGNIIAPLILWLLKKEDHWFVDRHGKEAVNFQITMTIYGFIALVLTWVLIGWLFVVILIFMEIILVIVAAVKASDGGCYRYPLTIRFIR